MNLINNIRLTKLTRAAKTKPCAFKLNTIAGLTLSVCHWFNDNTLLGILRQIVTKDQSREGQKLPNDILLWKVPKSLKLT